MSDFERFLLPLQEAPEPLDEALWGRAPTTEEIAATEAWSYEQSRAAIRRTVDELLPTCVRIDHLERNGIPLDIEKADEAIRAGHLIGFELGAESANWYPRWQFIEQADGTYTRNETLLDLWKRWRCVQGIEFCGFLRRTLSLETYDLIPDRLEQPETVNFLHHEIEYQFASKS